MQLDSNRKHNSAKTFWFLLPCTRHFFPCKRVGSGHETSLIHLCPDPFWHFAQGVWAGHTHTLHVCKYSQRATSRVIRWVKTGACKQVLTISSERDYFQKQTESQLHSCKMVSHLCQIVCICRTQLCVQAGSKPLISHMSTNLESRLGEQGEFPRGQRAL